MEAILRKHFWVVYLALIALGAYFAARTLSELIAAKIPVPHARPARAVAFAPPPQLPRSIDWAAVEARNIFCSTCAPAAMQDPAADAAAGVAGDGVAPSEPTKSTLNLQLLATLVSARDVAWSLAALYDPTAGRTRVCGIGSELEGLTVTEIRERRIVLLQGSRHEYLELGESGNASNSPTQVPMASAMSPYAAAGRGTDELGAQIASGVRATGGTSWEIQRSALNRVLTNTTLLARSARIIPSIRNGKPDGFRVVGIRPGSLYSLIGIQDGDLIQAINGLPMTTPEAALEVYTKVRNASHLSISFNRLGKPLTHDYVIR
ncbi:MAG: hypothetical protein IPG96_08895 [Proteobacteria bacterium]|nr:hypothetical protein [Pseudomonadota bacterium]